MIWPRGYGTLLRSIWEHRTPLAVYSVWIRVLSLVLLTPLSAWILGVFLIRWGGPSVGNFELIQFFLSIQGVLALLGVGSLWLLTSYLEIAGHVLILSRAKGSLTDIVRVMPGKIAKLLIIGFKQLTILLAMATPFLAAIGIVYWLLCSGKDIYGLIVLKPPRFLIAVAIAALLVVAYLLFAFRKISRWALCIPAIFFSEARNAREVLAESWRRTAGA